MKVIGCKSASGPCFPLFPFQNTSNTSARRLFSSGQTVPCKTKAFMNLQFLWVHTCVSDKGFNLMSSIFKQKTSTLPSDIWELRTYLISLWLTTLSLRRAMYYPRKESPSLMTLTHLQVSLHCDAGFETTRDVCMEYTSLWLLCCGLSFHTQHQ